MICSADSLGIASIGGMAIGMFLLYDFIVREATHILVGVEPSLEVMGLVQEKAQVQKLSF